MLELYKNDLDDFFRFYENAHICPYYFCSRVEIEKFCTDYQENHIIENDSDFVYFFKVMLKKLVGSLDTHSMIRTRDEYERLPLKIDITNNEHAVVTAASRKYFNLIGKNLIKINDIPIEQLLNEVRLAINYSTESYRRLETGRILSSFPIKILPSIDSSSSELDYEFHDANHMLVSINDSSRGYVINDLPQNFKIELNGRNLILHYTSCSEGKPGEMNCAIERIMQYIHAGKVDTFILDLRGNMGGDDRIARPLIESLEKVGKLRKVVLVDRAVQSATMFVVVAMSKIGAEMVGEEIGSSLNHFGNNCRHELPSGRFLTIVSTRYFYVDDANQYHTVRTRSDFAELDRKLITPRYLKVHNLLKSIDNYRF